MPSRATHTQPAPYLPPTRNLAGQLLPPFKMIKWLDGLTNLRYARVPTHDKLQALTRDGDIEFNRWELHKGELFITTNGRACLHNA